MYVCSSVCVRRKKNQQQRAINFPPAPESRQWLDLGSGGWEREREKGGERRMGGEGRRAEEVGGGGV